MSSTTTMDQMQKTIVKDLNGLRDTIVKFRDDLDDLMNNGESRQKLFREDVQYLKPGKNFV